MNGIEIGAEVAIVTGPGQWVDKELCSSWGTIEEIQNTRWGTNYKIKLEYSACDDKYTFVSTIKPKPIDRQGFSIGAYLLN